jgi:hypothetical protein
MSEIHWLSDVSAPFATAADWTGRVIPGASDDAILDAAGAGRYTVTASVSHTVGSIQTAATATLAIAGGVFTAGIGTGSGANAGAIAIDNGGALRFAGTLDNTGTVTLASATGAATLEVLAGGGSLTGGGTVDLANGGRDRICGVNASVALTNVDNTITGAGYLGTGSMAFDNDADGVVEASGGDLIVSTGANTIANAGLIEAGKGATLTLNQSTLANAGGAIEALAGGRIDLDGAFVEGGALTAQNGGVIVANSGDSTLDAFAAAMSFTGRLNVASGASLTLNGTFSGAGDIDLYAGAGTSKLIVGPDTVAVKGGQINLSDSSGNMIVGTGGRTVFEDDERIDGAGTIGDGNMDIGVGAGGVVDGTGSKPLVIDAGSQTISMYGAIVCTGSGGVSVEGNILGINGGLLFADGGNITVTGGMSAYGCSAEIKNATLKISAGITVGGNFHIDFSGATGELVVPRAEYVIAGFSPTGGMEIDSTAVPFIAGNVTFVPNSDYPTRWGIVWIDNGTSNVEGIILNGNFTSTTFITKNDGHGGTLLECEASGSPASAGAAPASAARKVAALVAAAASLAPAGGVTTGMAGADAAFGRAHLAMAVVVGRA